MEVKIKDKSLHHSTHILKQATKHKQLSQAHTAKTSHADYQNISYWEISVNY